MNSNFSAFLTEEEKELQRSFQVLKSVRDDLNAIKASRTGETAKINKGESSKAQTMQEAELRADETRRKAADGQISFNPGENRTTGFKRHTLRDKKESGAKNMDKSVGDSLKRSAPPEIDFTNRIPSIRDFKIPKKKPRTNVNDVSNPTNAFNDSFGAGSSDFGNSAFNDNVFGSKLQNYGNSALGGDNDLDGFRSPLHTNKNFCSKQPANSNSIEIIESSNSIEIIDKNDDFGNDSFANTGNNSVGSKQTKNAEVEIDPGKKNNDDPFGNDGFGNEGFGDLPAQDKETKNYSNNWTSGNNKFGGPEKDGDPFGNEGFGSEGFGDSAAQYKGTKNNSDNWTSGNNKFGGSGKDDDPFGNEGFGNSGFGGSSGFEMSNDSNRRNSNEHSPAGGGFGSGQSERRGGSGRGGGGQRGRGRGGGGGGRGVCNFFQRTGTCRFGDTCKFSHESSGNEGGYNSNVERSGGGRRGRGGGYDRESGGGRRGNRGGGNDGGWRGRDQGNMGNRRDSQDDFGAAGGYRNDGFGIGTSTAKNNSGFENDGFGNDGFGNNGF